MNVVSARSSRLKVVGKLGQKSSYAAQVSRGHAEGDFRHLMQSIVVSSFRAAVDGHGKFKRKGRLLSLHSTCPRNSSPLPPRVTTVGYLCSFVPRRPFHVPPTWLG